MSLTELHGQEGIFKNKLPSLPELKSEWIWILLLQTQARCFDPQHVMTLQEVRRDQTGPVAIQLL